MDNSQIFRYAFMSIRVGIFIILFLIPSLSFASITQCFFNILSGLKRNTELKLGYDTYLNHLSEIDFSISPYKNNVGFSDNPSAIFLTKKNEAYYDLFYLGFRKAIGMNKVFSPATDLVFSIIYRQGKPILVVEREAFQIGTVKIPTFKIEVDESHPLGMVFLNHHSPQNRLGTEAFLSLVAQHIYPQYISHLKIHLFEIFEQAHRSIPKKMMDHEIEEISLSIGLNNRGIPGISVKMAGSYTLDYNSNGKFELKITSFLSKILSEDTFVLSLYENTASYQANILRDNQFYFAEKLPLTSYQALLFPENANSNSKSIKGLIKSSSPIRGAIE